MCHHNNWGLQYNMGLYCQFMFSANHSAAIRRHLADQACSSLLKSEVWHTRQYHCAVVQAAAATGRYTQQLADAATGLVADAAGAVGQDSRASTPAQRSSTAGAGEGSAPAQRSSLTERWQPGPCDCHPQCKICQQEQQERSAGQPGAGVTSSSSSGGSGVFTCFPVQYDDPFLYRRLLWQLLGKLSPEAQAFMSKQAQGCPHCPSAE
jgi:hypothetical protein